MRDVMTLRGSRYRVAQLAPPPTRCLYFVTDKHDILALKRSSGPVWLGSSRKRLPRQFPWACTTCPTSFRPYLGVTIGANMSRVSSFSKRGSRKESNEWNGCTSIIGG